VYLTSRGDKHQQHDERLDMDYEAFKVDTDISDIMIYNVDTNRFSYNNNDKSQTKSFLVKKGTSSSKLRRIHCLKNRTKNAMVEIATINSHPTPSFTKLTDIMLMNKLIWMTLLITQ
jgi:hypothetical protein